MIGTGLVDYYLPAIQLRPLSYIFVIAVTALGGLRWGLLSGIFAAVLWTAIEAYGGYRSSSSSLLWNTLLSAASLVVTVALVETIRARTIAAQTAADNLRTAQQEMNILKKIRAAEKALLLSERRYRAIGESLPFGVWQTDPSGAELLYISESFCSLVGMSREQIVGGGWEQQVDAGDRERFLAAWSNREKQDVFEGEYRITGADGNSYWIMSRGVRLTDDEGETIGWAGFNLDVTQRKNYEERLAILSELGRQLSLSLDPQKTLERSAQLLVPRLADWCAIDLAGEDERPERVLIMHRDQGLTAAAQRLLDDARQAAMFGYEASTVIATRRPELRESASTAPSVARAPAEHDALLTKFGLGSLVSVPLIAREQTLGALTMVVCGSGRRFSQDDLAFAGIIARRIALAYDNARLYAREHNVADVFQRASLPASLPDIPGVAIRAHYLPATREAQIGGDWYDAFQLNDGRVALSIGDVAGKGLQAASVMSTVRLLIRAAALEDLPPSIVLARANALLLNDKPTMVTALFGILDLEELTFTCSIAGHPVPVVATAQGEISSARSVSPPLGIFPAAMYPEQSLMLPLGSLLVLYTDGLVEEKREPHNGDASLANAIQEALGTDDPNPARSIADRLVGSSPKDDVAVMTVAIAAHPLLELDLALPARPSSSRQFRQALRRLYLAVGLTEENIQMLQVAVGEAVMNSIEHAYGVQGGIVRVCARVDGGKLVIDVGDQGRWRAPHDDGGGYGLRVLKSIVQQVEVNRTEYGTVVRVTQPVGRPLT